MGNPVSAYERMYDEIEAAVPGLVEHLVSPVTSRLLTTRTSSSHRLRTNALRAYWLVQ